jgi:hypothetical protein
MGSSVLIRPTTVCLIHKTFFNIVFMTPLAFSKRLVALGGGMDISVLQGEVFKPFAGAK